MKHVFLPMGVAHYKDYLYLLVLAMAQTKIDIQVHYESLLHTSPWGVLETPHAQGGPRSDTRDLWRWWWEGAKWS
jgi:hypothetical protein